MESTRRTLPNRRASWTQKARVGGQTVYLSVGEYDDGTPGEIWIEVSKAGSALRNVMCIVAILVSRGVQHGIPLVQFVRTLRELDFLPGGLVEGSPEVTQASSILDFVARQLEAVYLTPRAVVAPPSGGDGPEVWDPKVTVVVQGKHAGHHAAYEEGRA